MAVSGARKVGTSNCEDCGAQVTYELVEGYDQPVALDTVQSPSSKENHQFLFRMATGWGRRFEPVTRLGQVGQMLHSQTCKAAVGGQHG